VDGKSILISWLESALRALKRPGPLYVFVEAQDMSSMRLLVALPPLSGADDDVESREISVKIGEGKPAVTALDRNATEFRFTAPRNAMARLALVDIDSSGNRSEASSRDVPVTDTIAPARPGELTVTVEGQEPDAPA
jgi:hypothetical protein